MNMPYFLASKIFSRLARKRSEYMSNYFRKKGCKVGGNCNILSDISIGEPYLVHIGNDVTISSEVLFLTHDASVGKIFGKEKKSDVLGEIIIGDNSFIGARSVILPGVTLSKNTIVAAGSIVTKSFKDSNIVIGGNPAHIISTWSNLSERTKDIGFAVHGKKGNKVRLLVEEHPEKMLRK